MASVSLTPLCKICRQHPCILVSVASVVLKAWLHIFLNFLIPQYASFCMFFYIAALTSVGVLIYSVWLIGPAAAAGVAVFLLMFPLQVCARHCQTLD